MAGFLDVTVSPYSASNDGSSPANTAFAQCISDAGSLGKPMWIPPGTYDLTGFTTVVSNNVVIIGAGEKLVTLDGGGATTDFFTFADNANFVLSSVKVTNFRRVLSFSIGGILGEIIVEDCDFSNIAYHVVGSGGGVDLATINKFVYQRNTSRSIGTASTDTGVVRLSADQCIDTQIFDNHMYDTGSATKTGRTFGIYVRNQDPTVNAPAESQISRNIIEGVKNNDAADCVGIMVLGGRTQIIGNNLRNVLSSSTSSVDNEGIYIKARNSVIASNSLVDCGGGEGTIIIKGRNRGKIDNTSADGFDNVIANNTVRSTGLAVNRVTGITITMDGCIVEGNHIEGGQRGIATGAGLSGTIIRGNTVRGLVINGAHTALFGITVTDTHGMSIIGNMLMDFSGTNSCYAIEYKTTAIASTGILISGNWIQNIVSTFANGARGIATSINSGSTVQKVIIESNHVDVANWGMTANGVDSALNSSCIGNSVSNTINGTISPASENWTTYANNS